MAAPPSRSGRSRGRASSDPSTSATVLPAPSRVSEEAAQRGVDIAQHPPIRARRTPVLVEGIASAWARADLGSVPARRRPNARTGRGPADQVAGATCSASATMVSASARGAAGGGWPGATRPLADAERGPHLLGPLAAGGSGGRLIRCRPRGPGRFGCGPSARLGCRPLRGSVVRHDAHPVISSRRQPLGPEKGFRVKIFSGPSPVLCST